MIHFLFCLTLYFLCVKTKKEAPRFDIVFNIFVCFMLSKSGMDVLHTKRNHLAITYKMYTHKQHHFQYFRSQ